MATVDDFHTLLLEGGEKKRIKVRLTLERF